MTVQRKSWHLPAWLLGVLCGDALWGLMWMVGYAISFFGPLLPTWLRQLCEGPMMLCAFAAFPVVTGGYLFVWGDNGPPHIWLNSFAFNIAFGLCVYALLGAAIGLLIARGKRIRPMLGEE